MIPRKVPITVVELGLSAVAIVVAAALFLNAVEMLGDRPSLGEGAVGSALALAGGAYLYWFAQEEDTDRGRAPAGRRGSVRRIRRGGYPHGYPHHTVAPEGLLRRWERTIVGKMRSG